MMEYTEPVYKRDADEHMCRVIDNINICIDGNTIDAVLTVDVNGNKTAYPASIFERDFYVFDAGESPASIQLRRQQNGDA